jgi:hypothetical protein
MVPRVQFCFLPDSLRHRFAGVLAHRQAPTAPILAPLQIVGAFRVPFLFAVHNHVIRLRTAIA